MSIEYRLITNSDYDHESVIRIGRAIQPDNYVSAEGLLDWEEAQQRAGRFNGRWLAHAGDRIIASALICQTPWIEETTMFTNIMVHPDHQRRGHGQALLTRVEGTARAHGATRLIANGDERDPRSIQVIERAGFVEVDREWRSTLDLAAFDPAEWEARIRSVEEAGVRIISVTELMATRSNWKTDLHRLFVEVEGDVPTPFDIREIALTDFESFALGRNFLPDGFLVAMAGDAIVGLTEPQPVDDEPTAIAQEMTGVRADYRGRGIATALKAAAATWAKEQGYTSIRTYNAQSNAPMLAVNTRMGFVREHGQIEYMKNL